jgi:hypothetical protein
LKIYRLFNGRTEIGDTKITGNIKREDVYARERFLKAADEKEGKSRFFEIIYNQTDAHSKGIFQHIVEYRC